MKTLPEKTLDILDCRNQTSREIASELGMSLARVSDILSRLKKRGAVEVAECLPRGFGKVEYIWRSTGFRPTFRQPRVTRHCLKSRSHERSWIQHIHKVDGGREVFGEFFAEIIPAHRHAYTVTHEVTPCHS